MAAGGISGEKEPLISHSAEKVMICRDNGRTRQEKGF